MLSRILKLITIGAFLAAVALIAWAYGLGIHFATAETVDGYFEKLNWLLFPVYFVLLYAGARWSWVYFLRGWKSLADHGVLWREGRPCEDASALAGVIESLRSRRRHLAWLALVLGMGLTAVDAGCLWGEYGLLGKPETCKETDFSIAFRLPQDFRAISAQANGAFVLMAYLLQGLVIAGGWLCLFQFWLHCQTFLRFERHAAARSEKLSIRLNVEDPVGEFGLSELNRALNLLYVFVAFGMLIPVLSFHFQPKGVPADIGQWLLRILLPLLFLVPFGLSSTDRWRRSRAVAHFLVEHPDKAASYRNQQLWPFERTQVGYIGKMAMAAVVAEYLYVAGNGLADIFKALAK